MKATAPDSMKITVDEIPQSPAEIKFSQSIEDLKETYRLTSNPDFGFPPSLDVELVYYRSGPEIFFSGSLRGRFTGTCGRCLEEYEFPLESRFDFVLIPDPVRPESRAEELTRDELGLSYYSTDEIDLMPLIGEQALLALPTVPLCSDVCRGLCAGCGADLNRESCTCTGATGDPRMALFRNLKVGR